MVSRSAESEEALGMAFAASGTQSYCMRIRDDLRNVNARAVQLCS